MNGKFWMGLIVGFLLGVIVTVVAALLWLVPVRRTTTPTGSEAAPVAAHYATVPYGTLTVLG